MDSQFKEYFSARWKKYFGDAELPITYFYIDQAREDDLQESSYQGRCLICNLNPVGQGRAFVYSAATPGCTGGKRYTGFSQKLRPNFEYFLSCGIPGEMEGERYKKTPELVQEHLERNPPFQAPEKYLVFKRWDRLAADEQPVAVIFYATPDVLAGLFTLANYDYGGPDGVIAPMGSGCASIINYPYLESVTAAPRCVLGMFDVSARPCVPANILTFTIPMRRFEQMVNARFFRSFRIPDPRPDHYPAHTFSRQRQVMDLRQLLVSQRRTKIPILRLDQIQGSLHYPGIQSIVARFATLALTNPLVPCSR